MVSINLTPTRRSADFPYQQSGVSVLATRFKVTAPRRIPTAIVDV